MYKKNPNLGKREEKRKERARKRGYVTIRFFISKYNTKQWYFKVKVHTSTHP